MREIRFRAWDNFNRRMIENPNIGWDEEDDEIMIDKGGGKWRSPKQLILMQYTGLKDKNGKEIYEGDVVKHSVEPIEINQIEFHNAQYHLEPHGLSLCDEYEIVEIIGNIHENPELLKEGCDGRSIKV